jgi:hypothetical protein
VEGAYGVLAALCRRLFTTDCKTICRMAARDPGISSGGGTVVCYYGTRCPCLFDVPKEGISIGECPDIDGCGYQHEAGHLADAEDCPRWRGLSRAPVRANVDTHLRECTQYRIERSCIERVLPKLKGRCIQVANARANALTELLMNCPPGPVPIGP